jgi:hypothetical protein
MTSLAPQGGGQYTGVTLVLHDVNYTSRRRVRRVFGSA